MTTDIFRKRDESGAEINSHLRAILEHAHRSDDLKRSYYMLAGLICAALVDQDSERDYIDDTEMNALFAKVTRLWRD